MKRLILILAAVVLAAVGIYCGWRYYNDVFLPNKQVTDSDSEQRELFEEIKPEPADEEKPGDGNEAFAKLKAQNSDAVGWITIDGTVIDYPIVQGSDNSYYLSNGFDGEYNYGLGCPFLDYRCRSDFQGFNSIVYAHHIQYYQAMFSDITLYKDVSFMREHPNGVLLTESGVHNVRFFAYMIVPNPSFTYVTEFKNKKETDAYIDDIFKEAYYTPELTADELKRKKDLHLLVLSTCTYEYWSARGVLVGVIQ